MSTEAREAKKALRNDIKARLSHLPEEEVTRQSTTAQNLILSLPQYHEAKTLSIYLSMPLSEVRTDLLVRDALGKGKRVFVPYIHSVPPPPKETHVGNTRDEYEGLGRDGWGIPHLSAAGIEERENGMGGVGTSLGTDGKYGGGGESGGGLDLIVLPGVAFDSAMSRMGHGAGFYDSYLTRFCADGKRRRPFLVGLCLAEQILPPGEIMMQEWDWRVDAVAVGDGRLLTSSSVA
ncbi:hypothetical protein LTR78_001580 [Recurvomyces mirabilis]|uniref:5-formyltetrahydrofolate cyclo-ligase n=1 Tax=Recurvomyces mirabilis TaxID=574656 RepID=A0AAE0WU85_9PEZI|nr:hypothetical protein LTR78_001580 [Recurvomyces mirabilis]KAK5151848.1 hypothetical protein LTS14_008982 [Recurvomyces mirabilis]